MKKYKRGINKKVDTLLEKKDCVVLIYRREKNFTRKKNSPRYFIKIINYKTPLSDSLLRTEYFKENYILVQVSSKNEKIIDRESNIVLLEEHYYIPQLSNNRLVKPSRCIQSRIHFLYKDTNEEYLSHSQVNCLKEDNFSLIEGIRLLNEKSKDNIYHKLYKTEKIVEDVIAETIDLLHKIVDKSKSSDSTELNDLKKILFKTKNNLNRYYSLFCQLNEG